MPSLNALVLLACIAGSVALSTDSQHHGQIDSSALKRPTANAPKEAAADDTAAKDRLHHSLYLPSSYESIKHTATDSSSSGSTGSGSRKAADTETDTKKTAQIVGQHAEDATGALKASPESNVAPETVEDAVAVPDWSQPQQPGIPCHHMHGHHLPSFGLGESVFGTILSEAARDVFGVEAVISSQMHDVFEDILAGPRVPHILNVLDGIVPAGGRLNPLLPPPFLAQPLRAPVFDVMITSSSAESDSNDAAAPTWEQKVFISSSSPTKLEALADMFEKQLQGSRQGGSSSSSSVGRKLKSGPSRVYAADVAQVLLGAARKLKAAGALPTSTHT